MAEQLDKAEIESENIVTGGTSRRSFLKSGAAVAGAAVASSMAGTAASEQPVSKPQRAPAFVKGSKKKRPNIVFIYTEGQRPDCLSFTGNKILKTPNMDRIAREGVFFNNSFCMNALCAPARAATMTGLYSHITGAYGNADERALPANIPIFTDLLHESGYEVAMVGKVHVPNGTRERYWDYYCGFNGAVTNYYAPEYHEGRKGKMGPGQVYRGKYHDDFPDNPAMDWTGVYADDWFTDKALDWLKEERQSPFFLMLCHQAPHGPFYRPRRYLNAFNGVEIPIPKTFDDYEKGFPGKPRAFADAQNKIGTIETWDRARTVEELVKDCYAGFQAVDDNIGRVLDYLESTNQLDDTVVLQSSDHGYFFGEWQCFDKRFMHEPSLRTPAMIRYPKEFQAGTRVDEMVINLDFAPTLLELAGVEAPEAMQGKSFVKLAQKKEKNWRKDFLYEYFSYPGNEQVRPHRGVRTERYKYFEYFLDPKEYEMYDLEKDPGELNNLAGKSEYAALQGRLAARVEELRKETGDHTRDSIVSPE
ncbi:MAG: sulfatase family protein [Acidobacteriaceae bacterium]